MNKSLEIKCPAKQCRLIIIVLTTCTLSFSTISYAEDIGHGGEGGHAPTEHTDAPFQTLSKNTVKKAAIGMAIFLTGKALGRATIMARGAIAIAKSGPAAALAIILTPTPAY